MTYSEERAEIAGIVAHGAPVFGLNSVGAFQAQDVMAPVGHYGDIVVGPDGQVLAAYQNPNIENGPLDVYVHLDPDGLGPAPFGEAIVATSTNVGGYDSVPPQPDRAIDVEVGLAYDHGNCSTRGRVYMVYSDEEPNESDDVDVMVRYSDDDGTTWSAPVRVNDDAVYTARVEVAGIAHDPDGDEICDVLDNSPTVSNPDQDPAACLQEMGSLSIAFDIPFGRGGATVSWNIAHEVDLVGFNVVEIRRGKKTQQNQELIPCSQCATGLGASYSFFVARHRGGRNIFVELVREGGVVETVGPAEWQIPGLGTPLSFVPWTEVRAGEALRN